MLTLKQVKYCVASFALLFHTPICPPSSRCLGPSYTSQQLFFSSPPLAKGYISPCLTEVRAMCGSAFSTLSCTTFKPLRLLSCIGRSVASCTPPSRLRLNLLLACSVNIIHVGWYLVSVTCSRARIHCLHICYSYH
jgi:hypothetical protein